METKTKEKCFCEIDEKSCCACVSMHCADCIGHNKFTKGTFCSSCGRPLKPNAILQYCHISELDKLRKEKEEIDIERRKLANKVRRLTKYDENRDIALHTRLIYETRATTILNIMSSFIGWVNGECCKLQDSAEKSKTAGDVGSEQLFTVEKHGIQRTFAKFDEIVKEVLKQK